jgi:death-on-curing protein
VTQTEYLDLEGLLGMVRVLGVGPVWDVGLLESALARPGASAFGEDVYATIDLKAAALLHSLARNHALVDGNKRLAWLAVVVFLDLNGCEVAVSEDEALDLVVEVARGAIDAPVAATRWKIVAR